jgi:hypothetical protein
MRRLLIFISIFVVAAWTLNVVYPISRVAEHDVQAIPGITNVAVVPANAIPIVGGHGWHKVSNSAMQLAHCMKAQRLGYQGLASTTYANDIVGAQAGVFWLKGLLGSARRTCNSKVTRAGDLQPRHGFD